MMKAFRSRSCSPSAAPGADIGINATLAELGCADAEGYKKEE
jgi:hypothetical protein